MIYVLTLLWQRGRRLISGRTSRELAVLFVVLFWYAASGFLFFELDQRPDLTWYDACWWTIVTMATVGYGDLFPQTTAGRFLVGVPTMFLGVGFLGFIISQVTTVLVESRSRRRRGMARKRFADHILIIHCPQPEVVVRLAEELRIDPMTRRQPLVLLDDHLDEIPDELEEAGIHFVRGNPATEETLLRAGLTRARQVIVLNRDPKDPGSDDRTLSVVLMVEHLHPAVRTVAQVADPGMVRRLEIAGCDSVLSMQELTTSLLVQELQNPGMRRIVEELTSNRIGQNLFIIPAASAMLGKPWADVVGWGAPRQMVALGLMREKTIMLNCSPDVCLQSRDHVIVLAGRRPPQWG